MVVVILLVVYSPIEERLQTDRMRGQLFENMVVADMMKRRANAGREAGLMFYRDSNGNEIDLLVPDGTGIEAYEIKSASTYSSSFETGFQIISTLRITTQSMAFSLRNSFRIVNTKDSILKFYYH